MVSLIVSSKESLDVLNELLELIKADIVYRRSHLMISATAVSKGGDSQN